MAQNPNPDLEKHGKSATEGAVADLKAGASHLAERGTAAASGVLDAGRDYLDRIREAGQDYAGRVYETGHKRAEEAAFYAELGYEEARDWTRSHPVQALGLAAGIGLLVGFVVARR
ncbi:YqjD family protein [Paracoccus angustae]|uniref:YqjD family protein n=1 Tax=Paracoccus angustae TaxID=1671480 RepID=A0ABV7U6U2_9RHOB